MATKRYFVNGNDFVVVSEPGENEQNRSAEIFGDTLPPGEPAVACISYHNLNGHTEVSEADFITMKAAL